MPKLWVKIVNNLRKLDRTTRGYSSPTTLHKQYKCVIRIVKTNLNRLSLPQPSTAENTPKLYRINQLNKSFTHFPQDLLIDLKDEI